MLHTPCHLFNFCIKDVKTLDGFAWYLALPDYSRPRQTEEDGEEAELGPDGDLVSAMMSTAIIPKLCKVVEKGGFDPFSSKDIRRLVDVAEEIEASVPRTEPKFEVRVVDACGPVRLLTICHWPVEAHLKVRASHFSSRRDTDRIIPCSISYPQ